MNFESLKDEKFNSSKLSKNEIRFVFGGERVVTARTTNGRVYETAEELCLNPSTGGSQYDNVRVGSH